MQTHLVSNIELLRDKLSLLNLDGFIIPSQDEFLGEYVGEHSKRLKWLTNFTGSNGVAIVLKDKAAFFTDGRYILQAQDEVDESNYEIYNLAEMNLIKWLKANINQENVRKNLLDDTENLVQHCTHSNFIRYKIGFDPYLHTNGQVSSWQNLKTSKNFEFIPCEPNIIDELWTDRPLRPLTTIFLHDIEYAGISAIDKIQRISQELMENNANALIITAPDSLCWLLNIRGTDIPYTPLVLGRAIVYANQEVEIFLNNISTNIALPTNVKIYHLDDMEQKLAHLKGIIQIDTQIASVWLINKLNEFNINILSKPDPCIILKACKNKAEIAGAYKSQLQDSIAICSFLAWLEGAISPDLTELSIADKLLQFRKQQADFLYPSFATIAAFAEHGAIIHYQPSVQTNKNISSEGILLIDSGGQYKGGTTDITRTIAIGTPSLEQQTHFTLVLKGHIALACTIFPIGTYGYQLDVLARLYLWQNHLNYDHGTGHGVGSFLSVHEGPQNISTRPTDTPLLPGMIISNEPGLYLAGKYGIRIENLVIVQECHDNSTNVPTTKQFLQFETITLVPIDKKLINLDLLTKDEVKWVNNCHQKIWDTLSPAIRDKTVLNWLKTAIHPI